MANRILLSVVAAGLIALGSTGAGVVGTHQQANAASMAPVKVMPAQILVTGKGMTLYIFTKDKPGSSSCNGKCAMYWPKYDVPMGMKVPATMTGMMGKFGSIMGTAGNQLTYDGSALYTFAADKAAGDQHGQGVGGVWWTVVAGTGMTMATMPAASPVKLASAKMLVTATGMSLYIFNNDKPDKSVCTGPCAKYWPALTVPAGTMVPATMTGITGKFGTTTRADGTLQITFDGAPLYTFLLDKKPGDLKGQGTASIWWAVTA